MKTKNGAAPKRRASGSLQPKRPRSSIALYSPETSRLDPFFDRVILESMHLRGWRSRRIDTSVGGVHVLSAKGGGQLPPVLVLHGLSAAGHLYETLLRRLRPHVKRVIAPDLLGHGFSDPPPEGVGVAALAPALLEAMDEVIDEPVVIFGNSLGGAAAVRFARERPDKVLGLVLSSPAGAAMAGPELDRFLSGLQFKSHEDALRFVDRLFERRHALRHVLAWGVRQKFGRPEVVDLIARFSQEDLLSPSEVSGLEMPVLLLWGTAEQILPEENLEWFRRHLPRAAHFERPPGFGHAPHIDRAPELSRRVLAFAERCAA